MDFFKRLVNKNFHNEPVEYIFARIIIPTLEYDHLYENQNRFDGKIWSEFKKTYNLKCKWWKYFPAKYSTNWDRTFKLTNNLTPCPS